MASVDEDIAIRDEIDAAWSANDYGKVLALLKEGSLFPNGFTQDRFDGDGADQQLLKQFVEERIELHEYVREGNLDEIKKLIPNKSEYYLNPKNQSAAFTAIHSENYFIYAYLKSRNAKLREEEEIIIKKLPDPQKNRLQEILWSYFPKMYDAPIFYLMSKSTYSTVNLSEDDLEVKILSYYEKLNDKIRAILQVVQYANNLEIIFDFNKNYVNDINLLIPKKATGATSDKTGITQIAAGCKRTENEILGTLAHELTHVAMNIVFKNNRKPYKESDKTNKENFTRLTESIGNELEKFRIPGKIQEKIQLPSLTDPAQKIIDVYSCYHENETQGELIVRIPHILAEYPENGKEWIKKNVPDLLTFYQTEVISNCEKVVKESFLIKPRSIVRSLNETVGEILEIKKHKLIFKNNLNNLEKFLDQSKQIFFLVTSNTRLSLFRILQALYSHEYLHSYDNYIVLKMETCINYWKDIEIAFVSESLETLVIECCNEINDQELLNQGIEKIADLFTRKTSKKVVFVAHLNAEETIDEKLKEEKLERLSTKLTDTDFCLGDLEEESQKKILDKKLQFQEIAIALDDLLCKDENLYKMIGSETIEKLHKKELIVVTDEKFGTSSLEGAYADILQRVDVQSMVREIEESKNFFIFTGTDKVIQKDTFVVKLACYIKNEIFKRDFENEIIDVADLKEFKITSKRLFLAKNHPSEEDFKKFCQNNDKKILKDKKKVYFISVKKSEDYNFILQCIYNPNFYIQRKIKRTKDTNNEGAPESLPSGFTNAVINGNSFENNFQYDYGGGRLTPPYDFGNNVEKQESMDEADLLKKVSNERVLIFADDPGMGKSTTITRLYESELTSTNNWIIRINLKDHIDAIREFNSSNLTKESFLKFLPNLTSAKKKLAEIFFHVSMDLERDFPYNLLIAFDGFDELLDVKDRQRTIYLLKFLKNETKCRIWIATRRQHKEELEKALSTSAMEFDPIDKKAKSLFIKKYFKDRLNLIWSEEQFLKIFGDNDEVIEGTKIFIYIQEFIKKMDSTFLGVPMFFVEGSITRQNLTMDRVDTGLRVTVQSIMKPENISFAFPQDSSSFLATPLQINLMLENSIDKFVDWINGNNDDVDFSHLGKDFLEVYEKYINRKYEIYFRKKNIKEKVVQKFLKKNLETFHENLAESYIKDQKVQRFIKKYQDLILLIGLIRSQNKNLQFFHYTFREYYLARFFVRCLTKKMSGKAYFYRIINRLIKNIFTLLEFYLLRRFIDFQLENVPEKKWNRINVQMFDQILMIMSLKENLTEKRWDTLGRTILHIAVEENNTNIFCLLFSRLKSNSLELKDSCGRNLLHLAAKNGNFKICNILIETANKYSRKAQEVLLLEETSFKQTCFHLAIESGNLQTVKLFFEKIKSIIHKKDHENYFLKKTICNDNIMTLAAKKNELEILKYLLDEAENIFRNKKKLLMAKGPSRMSAFHIAILMKNNKILKFLLENAEKLYPQTHERYDFFSHKEEHKQTILHFAAGLGHIEIMATILEKIQFFPPERQFGIMMARNSNGTTPFRLASELKNYEIMQILLEKAESTFRNDLKKFIASEGLSNETSLHHAAKRGDYETMAWLLETARVKLSPSDLLKFIMAEDTNYKTVLHDILYSNYWTEALIQVLLSFADVCLGSEKVSDLIIVIDKSGNTALDLAAEKNIEILRVLFEKVNKKKLSPEEVKTCEKLLNIS